MLRSLYTAGTGMVAQQHNLDVISNNLANVNTTGFKGQRAEFEDLMYQTLRTASTGDNTGAPENIQVGLGSKLSATTSMFGQGSLQETGNPLNMAIEGDGFFKLTQADGTAVYTRDGTFKADATGRVVNSNGLPLEPAVNIPVGSTTVNIHDDGTVWAIEQGQTSATQVGKVELTNFTNPAGLLRVGGNNYQATDASGQPMSGTAGQEGRGTILGGSVESSNVEVVSEMTSMITAQRAYEINSKAIQTADDMLGIVNNLKR